MSDDLQTRLSRQLKKMAEEVGAELRRLEEKLDSEEDDLESDDHEKRVVELEKWESLLECLDEALELLNG